MSCGAEAVYDWHRDVPSSARWAAFLGIAILLVWAAGFAVWAAFAPLDGAVVASGNFVATGQNKLVQHLEGGIVRELLVKEGDAVEPNQVVVRLDETAAMSKLQRLRMRHYRLLVMQARLAAEIEGADDFLVPSELSARQNDEDLQGIVKRQRTELAARLASRRAEESVLTKEIAGLEESIRGYQAQVASNEQRTALFAEELRDKNQLLERHLSRKTEVLALQRAEASLAGDLGELRGRIADSNERVARAHQRIVHLHTAAMQKAVQELRETETELDDVHGQIQAAHDVVQRVEVRAPVRGVVVKLNFHTTGGVVAPGATLAELLPVQEELVIEARINPSDIAYVREGQSALARLSALNQRVTPMIKAKVVYLSADRLAKSDSRQQNQPDAR